MEEIPLLDHKRRMGKMRLRVEVEALRPQVSWRLLEGVASELIGYDRYV